MAIAIPLIVGSIPIDKMMDMFILGGASMPVAEQACLYPGSHHSLPDFSSNHGTRHYRVSDAGEGWRCRSVTGVKPEIVHYFNRADYVRKCQGPAEFRALNDIDYDHSITTLDRPICNRFVTRSLE